MSKYNILWEYIYNLFNNSINTELFLTFDEINKITGFNIDHSFLNYKNETLEYKFIVQKISLKNKKIYFRRIND